MEFPKRDLFRSILYLVLQTKIDMGEFLPYHLPPIWDVFPLSYFKLKHLEFSEGSCLEDYALAFLTKILMLYLII